VNQEVLRDTMLDARAAGRTVIFSTHNMDQAEQLCEHVCIIARGEKVLDGALRDIRRANLGSRYGVEFETETPRVAAFMRDSGRLFARAARDGEGWEVELAPGADPREALAALNALDAPILRFARVQPTLHEIFVQRVGDAATAARRPEPARV
jgi:ABC-2 type transport system ATP-binding protein